MVPFVHLDVFTDRALTGNQLTVFPDAVDLNATTMQLIAREMNLSESAFVFPPQGVGTIARIRIFSLDRELPFAAIRSSARWPTGGPIAPGQAVAYSRRFGFAVLEDAATGAAASPLGCEEYLDYHGQDLRTRFRFLDTWLRTPAGWLFAARHTTAVLRDPPALSLPGADLCSYAGEYRLTAEITTVVRCTEKGLVAERAADRRRPTYRRCATSSSSPANRGAAGSSRATRRV
jgi:hypothetical protein